MKWEKFNRGDIVRLNLNPTTGREQQGEFRPALIISPAAFNVSGLVLIAPITQCGDFAGYAGSAITLSGSGIEAHGVVLRNQIRTVDLETRGAKRVESVREVEMDDVLPRIQDLIE